MTEHEGYLSDEQLEKLISEVEQEGLARAPESINRNVYKALQQKSSRQKVIEYYRYCIRVGVSVAAAIAFLIATPFMSAREVESREDVVSTAEIKTKEEVTNKFDLDDFVVEIKDSLKIDGGTK